MEVAVEAGVEAGDIVHVENAVAGLPAVHVRVQTIPLLLQSEIGAKLISEEFEALIELAGTRFGQSQKYFAEQFVEFEEMKTQISVQKAVSLCT